MDHRRGWLLKEGLSTLKGVAGEERGQALVIMVLTIVILTGFLALAVDAGHAYTQRRLMQNAADAGALAGVRILAVEDAPGPAIEAATEYVVDRNGGDSAEVTVDGQDVTVIARRTFSTFFADVVDWFALSAGARARARYGSPVRMPDEGFFPVTIRHGPYEIGPEYEIWDDNKEDEDAPPNVIIGGNRGWLNFDGGEVSNAELKLWARDDYRTTLSEDDWINGKPGTCTAAMRVVLNHRVGDEVIIPVYDTTRPGELGSGQVDYHIVSFALFRIDAVYDVGHPKRIVGEFQKRYIVGPAGRPDHNGIIAIEFMQ